MTRPVRAKAPTTRDPYGVRPNASWIAPALSVIGLVLVGILTFNLLQGEIPLGIGGSGGDGGSNGGTGNGNGNGSQRTPAPSNVVVVPEEAAFDGSIVYAKGGNIWIQEGDETRQLTDSGDGTDSQPSWSSDGAWVYYIHTVQDEGKWPAKGVVESVALDVPQLMRVRSDGSGKPQRFLTGKFKKGRNTYAFWIRQPVVEPNGRRIAVVSDAPNPDETTVVAQIYDPETKKFERVDVASKGILGHQDPEWRPDGTFLLFVRNGREGSRGAPQIVRYNPETKKAKALTGPGYLQPSYSPDGRFIAATLTTSRGTNVVILDGSSGQELMRVTDDDASWSPVWSPAGDGIAFLRIDGQTVDLHLAKLGGQPGAWTIEETIALTEVSGLDADSGPDWFIPADQLPATPPPPSVEPSSSSSDAAASPAP